MTQQPRAFGTGARRLAVALLLIAVAAVLVANRSTLFPWANEVSPGECVLPEGLGYHTVVVKDTGATYCVRLDRAVRLEGVTWSDDYSTLGLSLGSGPMRTVLMPKGGSLDVSTFREYRIVDTVRLEMRDLFRDVDYVGLQLSPDGSRTIAATCYINLSSCDSVVLDTVGNQVMCRYTMSQLWFSGGCEGVRQADGAYWDIKLMVNRGSCLALWLRQAMPEWCAEFVNPVVRGR